MTPGLSNTHTTQTTADEQICGSPSITPDTQMHQKQFGALKVASTWLGVITSCQMPQRTAHHCNTAVLNKALCQTCIAATRTQDNSTITTCVKTPLLHFTVKFLKSTCKGAKQASQLTNLCPSLICQLHSSSYNSYHSYTTCSNEMTGVCCTSYKDKAALAYESLSTIWPNALLAWLTCPPSDHDKLPHRIWEVII
ncbi:hypothetical protein E2C01_008839 [Portunus trituberculatus]|uniref:Uncharacterized protein n=1 Tax=Portunus trituberculatus TaxID=210409 RepID=A0A5B7D330_PORTR|nr:hypothetical protein [Portunus trituberculatus]